MRIGTRNSDAYRYSLDAGFGVGAFIDRVADQTVHVLDPNSLMYPTRAMEYFDLERSYGSLEQALAPISANVLFAGYRRAFLFDVPGLGAEVAGFLDRNHADG